MSDREFFERTLGVTDNGAASILAGACEHQCFEAGDLVVRAGDRLRRVGFLVRGIFRGYYFDMGGNEVTDCFASRYGAAVAPPFKEADFISPINIQALTDGELLNVPIEVAVKLLSSSAACANVYGDLLRRAYNEQWEAKQVMSQKSAGKRYEWFMETYPEVAAVTTARVIASFLGMTPVTLSRISRARPLPHH